VEELARCHLDVSQTSSADPGQGQSRVQAAWAVDPAIQDPGPVGQRLDQDPVLLLSLIHISEPTRPY